MEAVTLPTPDRGNYVASIQPQETDLNRELVLLERLLGDTRVRFRHGQTKLAAAQHLIDVDMEIRDVLTRPASAELQSDVRRLAARLRKLDPH
jgi:hypothetical protein